ALLTGEQVSSLGAGEVWHFFERMLNYPLTLLNANEFNRLSLRNYNVLIIPDGFYRSLNDKSAMDKLKEFVKNGGKVIAMENAVSMLAGADWGI
ncbi:zinc carboxypeptidase, partial [Acinetobacter johnsonii]